jgi:glycolate oxidase
MSFISKLQRLIGKNRVRLDGATLKEHASDAWLMSHLPEAVVYAQNTQDVSRVMKFAHQNRIPITVRGAGVGYVGGAVPIQGGIVLSLAKMNRIREIHTEDGVAVVEAGVITGELQAAVRKKGLFYPPDPASLKECTIGGNIATNAGGPRCLKYGVTRTYILGLEVVLPTGEILRVGSRTHKNKTGFDLVGIFVGSEGLLGTVTQATLRLLPHPPSRACISAAFTHERYAARAVQRVLSAGFLPCALEVADSLTLEAARKHVLKEQLLQAQRDPTYKKPAYSIPTGGSHLIVELDGHRNSVRNEIRQLAKLVRKMGAISIKVAETEEACEAIWDIRRQFSRSLKATGLRKLNEDVTVPRSRLVDLFAFAKKLQKRFGIRLASFGHAGDGNIHVNLMIDVTSKRQVHEADKALDALFRQVIAWGGVITGEHGIGLAKKKWWPLAVSPEVRELHQRLKTCLDPHGILNPGKFVSSYKN